MSVSNRHISPEYTPIDDRPKERSVGQPILAAAGFQPGSLRLALRRFLPQETLSVLLGAISAHRARNLQNGYVPLGGWGSLRGADPQSKSISRISGVSSGFSLTRLNN